MVTGTGDRDKQGDLMVQVHSEASNTAQRQALESHTRRLSALGCMTNFPPFPPNKRGFRYIYVGDVQLMQLPRICGQDIRRITFLDTCMPRSGDLIALLAASLRVHSCDRPTVPLGVRVGNSSN